MGRRVEEKKRARQEEGGTSPSLRVGCLCGVRVTAGASLHQSLPSPISWRLHFILEWPPPATLLARCHPGSVPAQSAAALGPRKSCRLPPLAAAAPPNRRGEWNRIPPGWRRLPSGLATLLQLPAWLAANAVGNSWRRQPQLRAPSLAAAASPCHLVRHGGAGGRLEGKGARQRAASAAPRRPP